ncbi:MAG: DNA polymerase III subunit delta [Alicyclobacillus macrosporangiidus]|uniref:DNA polymerase III subunit delta n=1 Tax=Alicyclobacillus macrosporangiidus TaxID=392015 RepID=UPI0026ECB464|nr:DNA polymerase III subunit delta [Alicyclobacillus macrosporangiidus]MCL6598215.1 DNA polymerase III subunit delta [Alicyclobacillus macrosporangiidus]
MLDWTSAMKAVQEGDGSGVFTLVGHEYALAESFVQALRNRLGDDQGPADVQRFPFDEEGCEGAVFALESLTLFQVRPVVVLQRCTAMAAGGRARFATDALEAYLVRPVPGRALVITVEQDKLDERKKLVKLAKQHIVVDCHPPKEAQALAILQQLAAAEGIGIHPAAMKELWRRTASVSAALQEMRKLWMFTGERPITPADVAEAVAPPVEDDVFAWVDGVVQGRADRAFRALADVQRKGEDPLKLFALIARQIRLMWYTRVLGERGMSHTQIAAEVAAHPYAVRVAAGQAARVNPERMERLLTVLADLEFEVKSGRRDPHHALELAVLACC